MGEYVLSFKELTVWKRSIEVVKEVYTATDKLSQSKLYGLTSQMRRAAVSVPTNIAAGKKRRTKKDFLMFLRIADGPAAELETLLIIVKGIYPQINLQLVQSLLTEVQKTLITMIKRLETSNS